MNAEIYHRKANYYETDKMGIVHHSNHIRYFEEARIQFMTSIGCDVKELEERGIIIPNVDAYARYKKPIHFSDEVDVQIQLTVFNGAKMVFEYTALFSNTGEVATTGYTTHCFVNSEFKPLTLKRNFPEYYERLKAVLVK